MTTPIFQNKAMQLLKVIAHFPDGLSLAECRNYPTHQNNKAQSACIHTLRLRGLIESVKQSDGAHKWTATRNGYLAAEGEVIGRKSVAPFCTYNVVPTLAVSCKDNIFKAPIYDPQQYVTTVPRAGSGDAYKLPSRMGGHSMRPGANT